MLGDSAQLRQSNGVAPVVLEIRNLHQSPPVTPGRQLFISLEHEKSAYGVFSPGPCTASVEAAASSKRLSTQRQPSAWGFGTSRRLPLQRNDAPGPGEYYA
jgi:3-hydroxymyristoyl/3-hydroxydecanoyl-(acyl carrier protein) dehydratase